MPASAKVASPNPACLIGTDPRPEPSENLPIPPRSPGTKVAYTALRICKSTHGDLGNVAWGSGCELPALCVVLRRNRADGHGFRPQGRPPRHGASLGKARRGRRQRSPIARGIGRKPLKAWPLEGFAKSHASPFSPANLNRPTAPNVLSYRWGESVPPNAGTGHGATHRRRVVIICPHRHSANRRRVYEDTHFDFGSSGARARRDGVVGERPAARRRPRAAAERHADREERGVSRVWCALRAGIHLGLRPLWPLLLPPLRLSGLLSQYRSDARPPLRGLVVYGQPVQFSGRPVK
jgi:hypothetical protein